MLLATLPAQELERTIQAAEALKARTDVAVADADGRVLFRHRAEEAFAPASNMKVLTAAAVLQGLGANHQFTTPFTLRAGRLVVAASGDPNWITGSAHAPEAVFAEVAASLQRLGVVAVRGIDLEAGRFLGPARPATWPQDQLQTRYCAPTGPFVLDQGTFAVAITAGRAGQAVVAIAGPRVATAVRGAIDVVETAKNAVYGAQDLGDAVSVRGRFYRKSPPVTIHTAVADPTSWYEAALRHALSSAGIRVDPNAAVTAADGPVLEYRSDLPAALLRMLEDSSNFDAEQCLRVLGQQRAGDGSLAGGLAVLQRQLVELVGELPAGVVLLDGSGLSKGNRLTPALLVTVLQASQRQGGGKVLLDALPVSGRTGTLDDRFLGTDLVGRVHAKTGWIRGASALSGCVVRRDGKVRWFSILMNYDAKQKVTNKDLKKLQETMVAALERLEAPR